jgi:hypothetical protein
VTTLAHVLSTDLPEAVAILTSPGLGENAVERFVPLEAFLDQGLLPLAEGRACGKIVVDVGAS